MSHARNESQVWQPARRRPRPASQSAASISVMIPTKDRPHDLALTVRSLLQQSLSPAELLIADQSRDDLGRRLVEEEIARARERRSLPTRLRFFRDAAISGAADGRNRLMDQAIGEIWVFLDDDVCLEEDFLEQIVKTYLDEPELSGVSGIITNYVKPPWPVRVWPWAFARGVFHDERQPIYWSAARLRGKPPIPVRKFTGACMSFRADRVRALRFDRKLTGRSLAEDADFCARLAPQKLAITPQARLVHKRSSINRRSDHWLREHAQAAYYLYRNSHPGWNERLSFWWLRCGYLLVVPACCLRRLSLAPWRAFRAGVQQAKTLTS